MYDNYCIKYKIDKLMRDIEIFMKYSLDENINELYSYVNRYVEECMNLILKVNIYIYCEDIYDELKSIKNDISDVRIIIRKNVREYLLNIIGFVYCIFNIIKSNILLL